MYRQGLSNVSPHSMPTPAPWATPRHVQGDCAAPVLGQALHEAAHVAHVHGVAAGRAAPVAGCLVLRLELLRQRGQPRAHRADVLMPQLHLQPSRLSQTLTAVFT